MSIGVDRGRYVLNRIMLCTTIDRVTINIVKPSVNLANLFRKLPKPFKRNMPIM